MNAIERLKDTLLTNGEYLICPVCQKQCINLFAHITKNKDAKHIDFNNEINNILNNIIDPIAETKLGIEINEIVRTQYPWLDRYYVAGKIRQRIKDLGLNPRKALGKTRQGLGNPVHKPGVKEKISQTVKELWEYGTYADRINGMLNKHGAERPNFDASKHSLAYIGKTYFAEFLSGFQDINVCSLCGCENKDGNMNIHHIDENHKNFLPSNLEPLCVPCHMKYHYSRTKRPYVAIGKTFYFAAAHQLPFHEGLCQYLHGHEWKLEVVVRKRINPDTGMVMDFSDLKKCVKKYVIDVLDHSNLNENLFNPTAENILIWVWEKLMFEGLLKGIHTIRLWESRDSMAELDWSGMLSLLKSIDVGE